MKLLYLLAILPGMASATDLIVKWDPVTTYTQSGQSYDIPADVTVSYELHYTENGGEDKVAVRKEAATETSSTRSNVSLGKKCYKVVALASDPAFGNSPFSSEACIEITPTGPKVLNASPGITVTAK
jgi:hypothetical protein